MAKDSLREYSTKRCIGATPEPAGGTRERAPAPFRITNAPERLAASGDPWEDAAERKQDLQKALKKG